jgi:hypothetical protein
VRGAIEIKLTVSEAVTPTLFAALMAVSNPRQRAALLKRLADDALRGRGSVGLIPTADQAHTAAQQSEVTDRRAAAIETQMKSASAEDEKPQALAEYPEQSSPIGDDRHLNYLADSLSAFA